MRLIGLFRSILASVQSRCQCMAERVCSSPALAFNRRVWSLTLATSNSTGNSVRLLKVKFTVKSLMSSNHCGMSREASSNMNIRGLVASIFTVEKEIDSEWLISSLLSLLVDAYSCFNPAMNHSNEYFSISSRCWRSVACCNFFSLSSSSCFLNFSMSGLDLLSVFEGAFFSSGLSLMGPLNISSSVFAVGSGPSKAGVSNSSFFSIASFFFCSSL